MLIPKGEMAWYEEVLILNIAMQQNRHVQNILTRTLQLVRASAALITVGPVLFHIGEKENGNVLRATPFSKSVVGDTPFFRIGDRWFLLDLLDGEYAAATKIQKVYRGRKARKALFVRNEAATVIQKYYAGWKVRMVTAFNPTTTLGSYYALRLFHAIVID
jgi:hypothetical protein